MYTILLVDDEKKHLLATIKYLNSYGFDTFGVSSAKEGLDFIAKVTPDLIIMDIMMPDSDGYDFIGNLRKKKNLISIPFVFLTAKGMTEDRIRGYNFGCNGYIPKPFDPEELLAVINNILFRKKEKALELYKVLKKLHLIRLEIGKKYGLEKRLDLPLALTKGEHMVLNYVLKGLRSKDISDLLNTSVRNIEKFITKIFIKTETRNRVELVNYCHLNKNFLRANDGIRTRA
jgi:DNA-binding NarL/FixJ family response regulator